MAGTVQTRGADDVPKPSPARRRRRCRAALLERSISGTACGNYFVCLTQRKGDGKGSSRAAGDHSALVP